MSLNGLDDPKLTDAFQAAGAEPGGWFLLEYTSRDQVGLLHSGTGGIAELRTSLESAEDSPLYGYIKYRRRNVVLKYLPQDSSRLIQGTCYMQAKSARVAVHFNFVCEHLSPYDAIFEIDSPKSLTDTKLSAACSLHTASGSTSSSASSRKKRLVEIAEEEEDEHPPSKYRSLVTHLDPPKTPLDSSWDSNPVVLNSDLASSPEQSKFSADDTAEPPTFVGAAERPSTSDSCDRTLSGTSSYPYAKAKIKLGPRPSLDSNFRPQTAGNFRPVSAIPAGYKLFGKSGKRSKSRDSNILVSPQEEIISPQEITDLNFAVSPEDKESSKENTDPALNPAKKTVSPEKARLKKAMQLRAKKRLAATTAARKGDDDDDAAITTTATEFFKADTVQEMPIDEKLNAEPTAEHASEPDSLADAQSTSSLADQTSQLTSIDSHPTSPALGGSETARSTTASSIFEATDQTAETPHQPAVVLTAATAISENLKTHMAADEHITSTEASLFGNDIMDPNTTEEPVAMSISKFSANNSSTLSDTASVTHLPVQSKPAEESVALAATVLPQLSAEDLIAATRAAAKPCVETPSAEFAQNLLTVTDPGEPAQELIATTAGIKEADSENVELFISPSERPESKRLAEPFQNLGIKEAEKNCTPTAASVITETSVTPETVGVAALPLSANTTPQSSTVRTVSNPVRSTLISPSDVNQSTARSMSSGAAYLQKITQQQQQAGANLSSKSNVGSSISQRIKALEMLSASNATESRPVSRERPQSTFFSVKKSDPSRAPSVKERTSSLRGSAPPSRDGSDSSPETARSQRGRSGSISNRLSIFQPSSDSPLAGSESISVTAKIVRDANQQMSESPGDLSGFNPLHLKQSPLFVSHQKPMGGSVNSSKGDECRSSVNLSLGSMEKRSTGVDSVSGTGPRSPPKDTLSPRLSISSSRRSTGKEGEEGSFPELTEAALVGDERTVDSKLSRAGRFMRRLSTLSSSRSKNSLLGSASSKSLLQDDDRQRMETPRPSTTGTSSWVVSYLGDVNVQFPDNLLWKRRNMSIDSQGFLVLSALPVPSSRTAQGTKRYHLSEFRPPYCPDVEVQELPNSVVLDFVEGTSLQLACEDRSGQMSVLNDLTDAHSKHAQ